MADSAGGHGVAGGSGSYDGGDQSPPMNVREQDRFLPIANIGRIMKKALPANGKIAKDAKDTVQECVSEFISFVTSDGRSSQHFGGDKYLLLPESPYYPRASDKCQKEKRKTINGDDLLWAMGTLGFEDYIAPLKAYLIRYRELEGETKGPAARSADGSAKKDILGTQRGSDARFTHQGSFSQGFSYSDPQLEY